MSIVCPIVMLSQRTSSALSSSFWTVSLSPPPPSLTMYFGHGFLSASSHVAPSFFSLPGSVSVPCPSSFRYGFARNDGAAMLLRQGLVLDRFAHALGASVSIAPFPVARVPGDSIRVFPRRVLGVVGPALVCALDEPDLFSPSEHVPSGCRCLVSCQQCMPSLDYTLGQWFFSFYAVEYHLHGHSLIFQQSLQGLVIQSSVDRMDCSRVLRTFADQQLGHPDVQSVRIFNLTRFQCEQPMSLFGP